MASGDENGARSDNCTNIPVVAVVFSGMTMARTARRLIAFV